MDEKDVFVYARYRRDGGTLVNMTRAVNAHLRLFLSFSLSLSLSLSFSYSSLSYYYYIYLVVENNTMYQIII